MKLFTIIFSLFFIFGCSQNQQKIENKTTTTETKKDDKKYGLELIDNDFLRYSNPEKIDSLKIELQNSFSIYNEETFKFAQIDAEELAEFSFDHFLPQINRMLKKRNLNLTVKTANDYEKTNNIIINGEKINLYTKQELEKMTFWDSAPRNFFKKVNQILQSKNVNEKFYLLYGGNDLSTLLLTEKQFEIIKDYYKNESNEIPYLP